MGQVPIQIKTGTLSRNTLAENRHKTGDVNDEQLSNECSLENLVWVDDHDTIGCECIPFTGNWTKVNNVVFALKLETQYMILKKAGNDIIVHTTLLISHYVYVSSSWK